MDTPLEPRHLADLLPPHAITAPGDPDFDRLRRVWNGMIDRSPALILRPESAAQVAAITRRASEGGMTLAIRCGGHSFPGFSTCDGGLLLDLSALNRVRADPDARVAEVGGGALLGDLDRASAPLGLVTPAGLVSHTGAGGLTLGGGMGWTSRRLGLTIDNMLSVELVTADGRVIEVSPATDPELFWGLSGGGGNFGVVTRFRFRLNPLGRVTVGKWQYEPARVREGLLAMADLARDMPRTVTTVVNVTAAGLTQSAVHIGEDGFDTARLAAFGRLAGPGEGALGPGDYVQLQSRSDDFVRHGRRYYGKGGFLARMDAPVAGAMAAIARKAPNEASEIYMIQLGGAVSDVAEEATAYSGRAAAFYWIVMPIWDDPADDARCLAWGREGGRILAALSEAGNYVNEQSDVSREVSVHAYGEAKYHRLARLKARMDPGNLFRLNQNILPG